MSHSPMGNSLSRAADMCHVTSYQQCAFNALLLCNMMPTVIINIINLNYDNLMPCQLMKRHLQCFSCTALSNKRLVGVLDLFII